ncbi:cytochrome c oxidase cbb3-type subunit 2 [Granulicella pectinivorans]|uniref:Cytochrome c oxidase cbb3-type subunit 2 n=1 Tax=Granulicella pectinivorans TaxID=474950 RepID=A0A1I6MM09_9BACT|nr:cbb3-type cytochrome c oxidase subunit II [Granulicella pectinivorans]SFS16638.1 cytochrome c oxidase cbb3-type subunit 2 [Granulicella pectinivorans]
MPRCSRIASGWRGISLVAITYVYFLIFAQFGFLKRLAQLEITDSHLKAVMAAMAAGGILLSLLAPRVSWLSKPESRLQVAFALSGGAALLSLLPLGLPASIAVSFLIGTGLGLLTVTLVTHLRRWLGAGEELLKVGLGTGLGYLICNLPLLFTSGPQTQAWTSAALCAAGIAIAGKTQPEETREVRSSVRKPMSFPVVLLCFTALVWLDSAAFFIIQSTPALKAGTWQGALHLWANGVLHLVAACGSAWLLRRRGLSFVLSAAFAALACACVLLLEPNRVALASLFYPIGVSLYSVALVGYPALLAPATSTEERARKAGWIYAIAGWMGSALGIGMGQNLGHVPVAFVLLAGAVVLAQPILALLRTRRREVLATAVILVTAFAVDKLTTALGATRPSPSQVERGRQVYIQEGCIQCHSQYVRPGSADVLMWGPVQTMDELRRQHPPLIGNRRQGPDLAEVGTRRSALWLRMHFEDPAALTHGSFMPSYASLFRTGSRGEDLVVYLQSLRGEGEAQQRRAEDAWQLSPESVQHANAGEGAGLFLTYCSTCHAESGQTRARWNKAFRRMPPNLMRGPLLSLDPAASPEAQREHLSHLIKFGIPGTDMPGHEYMPDTGIAALSLWLSEVSPATQPTAATHDTQGATP